MPADSRHALTSVSFSAAVREPISRDLAPSKIQPTAAGAALELALSKISDTNHRPFSKASAMSGTMRSTMTSTSRSLQSVHSSNMQHAATISRQKSRLASTRKLEQEQAERAELIRARNL